MSPLALSRFWPAEFWAACPPGTGKRGPADGAARHPYHGATPETATGTGALPSNVPANGRAPAPAKGSLTWTNGAKGVSIWHDEGRKKSANGSS